MSEENQTNQPQSEGDGLGVDDGRMVDIKTVDQFAFFITAWHQMKIELLSHTLQVPEGTKMGVKLSPDTDEQELTLVGDVRSAFRAGLTLALIELGKLPFERMEEPDESTSNPEPETTTPT